MELQHRPPVSKESIEKMFSEGKNVKQVAEFYGMKPPALYSRLEKMNILLPGQRKKMLHQPQQEPKQKQEQESAQQTTAPDTEWSDQEDMIVAYVSKSLDDYINDYRAMYGNQKRTFEQLINRWNMRDEIRRGIDKKRLEHKMGEQKTVKRSEGSYPDIEEILTKVLNTITLVDRTLVDLYNTQKEILSVQKDTKALFEAKLKEPAKKPDAV